jgi:hypothetical protein
VAVNERNERSLFPSAERRKQFQLARRLNCNAGHHD